LGPGGKVVFKKKHKKWWHVRWKYEPHRRLRATRAANSGGKKYFSIVSFDSSLPSLPSCMMWVVVRPLICHWHSFFFFLSFSSYKFMSDPPHFHVSPSSYFSFVFFPLFLISICFISINFSNFVLFPIAFSFNLFPIKFGLHSFNFFFKIIF